MILEVKIPGVGESVREAVLAQWLKGDGDAVKKEEPILVIETDKVSLEVAAEADGVLCILVPAGSTVPIGAVVATIDVSEGAAASVSEQLGPVPAEQPVAERGTASSKAPPAPMSGAPVPAGTVAAPANAPQISVSDSKDLFPSVRRLIRETGIDPAAVAGTGPGGRVTKGDVLLYLESLQTAASPAAVPAAPAAEDAPDRETADEPVERKAMTPIRQRIAERLILAKQQTAMLTTFNEIDMSRVMALRARYKDAFQKKHGVSLGFMGFFIKASIAALRDFPEINAFIDGSDIVYHRYYHIGIAVGSKRGLVVPVLRHADRMGFADMENAIGSAVERIASGKLKLGELEGGTFTISNGGVYGSLLSTPILNPPQSGILGMHKIEKRPIVVDDAIVIRPMMYVALSYDHRIVDGAGAVSFLKRIKECIEEPERLMMEM